MASNPRRSSSQAAPAPEAEPGMSTSAKLVVGVGITMALLVLGTQVMSAPSTRGPSGGPGEGEIRRHRCALARHAFRSHAPVVSFYHVLDNRQSEPGSPVLA